MTNSLSQSRNFHFGDGKVFPREGTYEIIGIDSTHNELILSFNGGERLFDPFFVNKV